MKRYWLVLAPLLAASGPAAAAGAMRCDARIVDEGTRAAVVLAACGEPDYRDVWQRGGEGDPGGGAEDWYYDFGPSQLLRILRLRDGRVAEIETDGYGLPPGPGTCAPLAIVEGLSEYRLLRLCGAPLSRRSQEVLVPWTHRPGDAPVARAGAWQPVHREEWVYNFGARHLLRIVTLEDGRVSDVQNGERGFD